MKASQADHLKEEAAKKMAEIAQKDATTALVLMVAKGASPTAASTAAKTEVETAALLEDCAVRSDATEGDGPAAADQVGWQWEGSLGAARRRLADIMTHGVIANFSTALVLANLVLMAMPYEGMSETYERRLDVAADTITWVFIVEMGLKLVGLGWRGYWSDSWNRLDGTIVTMSCIEMLFSAIISQLVGGDAVNVSFLRILRILRVMRMLRLMRSWQGLYLIVTTFLSTIQQMRNLLVLCFLLVDILALLGMQLFGGKFTPHNGFSLEPCPPGAGCPDSRLAELPRTHFDSFFPAMLTTFTVLTDEWIAPMQPALKIEGAQGETMAFFILSMLIGRYLMMNLLITVVLNAFADTWASQPDKTRLIDFSEMPASDDEEQAALKLQAVARGHTSRLSISKAKKPLVWPTDYYLCCCTPRNCAHNFCLWLVEQPLFDRFIVGVIVLSSICLALDSPRLDPESSLAMVLLRLDIVWLCIFSAECLFKITAHGLCLGPGAYFTSAWNRLDFTIVTISLVVVLAENVPSLAGAQGLRSLRILRVLRPLRLVSRTPGMRLIITNLVRSLPAVGNVTPAMNSNGRGRRAATSTSTARPSAAPLPLRALPLRAPSTAYVPSRPLPLRCVALPCAPFHCTPFPSHLLVPRATGDRCYPGHPARVRDHRHAALHGLPRWLHQPLHHHQGRVPRRARRGAICRWRRRGRRSAA